MAGCGASFQEDFFDDRGVLRTPEDVKWSIISGKHPDTFSLLGSDAQVSLLEIVHGEKPFDPWVPSQMEERERIQAYESLAYETRVAINKTVAIMAPSLLEEIAKRL
jgi:hypothetical protein